MNIDVDLQDTVHFRLYINANYGVYLPLQGSYAQLRSSG